MDAPSLGRLATLAFVLTLWAAPAQAQDLAWPDENRRVGWTEVTVVGGATAALIGLHFAIEEPDEAAWIGPVLLDDAVRTALVSEGEAVNLTAALSDVLLFSLLGWSVAIDSIGVAGLANDEWDAAFQTTTIAAQSHALNALVTHVMKYSIGRRRPGFGGCYDDPTGDEGCADRSNLSFPSGHTSTAFTGAGLICVTHENVAYYKGVADRIACYTALGLATATGLLRITSNNHYLSDIVMGAVIGLSAGYLLPRLVYFNGEPARQTAAPLSPPSPPMMQFGGRF